MAFYRKDFRQRSNQDAASSRYDKERADVHVTENRRRSGRGFTPSYHRAPRPTPEVRPFQRHHNEPRSVVLESSSSDMQLNKATNAWKPSVVKVSFAKDPEEIKINELLGSLRCILNKLTPEKFHALTTEVMELPLDKEARLMGAAGLIFEKAIMEPHFSGTYAKMCRRLKDLNAPASNGQGKVTFHHLLLHLCQEEFEKAANVEATDEDKCQEARDKAKRRSLGNMKFIGELFKEHLLKESVMHRCIRTLLKITNEESLEQLCRLLCTAGRDLDTNQAKAQLDEYFHQINGIIRNEKASARICFMLQDVVDLRKNDWVPRREEQGPKTIGQIHSEAAKEKQEKFSKVHQQQHRQDRMGGNTGGWGPRANSRSRPCQPQDEAPITRNRPSKTSPKITKKREFTPAEQKPAERRTKVFQVQELRQHLDRLLQDKASNQLIRDWLEANVDKELATSNQFVSVLVTLVCQSSIRGGDVYWLDTACLRERVGLLQTCLSSEQKQLQALYALQVLMGQMNHPQRLLLMIFDTLFEEDVVYEGTFLKWRSRDDPEERGDKASALESVKPFFKWLNKEEEAHQQPALQQPHRQPAAVQTSQKFSPRPTLFRRAIQEAVRNPGQQFQRGTRQ